MKNPKHEESYMWRTEAFSHQCYCLPSSDALIAKIGGGEKRVDHYYICVHPSRLQWAVAPCPRRQPHIFPAQVGNITGSAITSAPLCQLLQNGQFPV